MDKFLASLIFFTRLPIWRHVNPPQSAYKDIVVCWPYVGWITGSLVAVILYGGSIFLPWIVTILLALLVRVRFTGALHEDGLADFCDGFGCGGDKPRILGIMKDSHIGTYGVIALILYFGLMVAILWSLPKYVAIYGFIAGDAFGKLCAAYITNILPYARREGPKNGISYSRMNFRKWLICFMGGILPLALAAYVLCIEILYAAILPIFVMLYLVIEMRQKIGGYTGDCCGATFLLCELSFLFSLTFIFA